MSLQFSRTRARKKSARQFVPRMASSLNKLPWLTALALLCAVSTCAQNPPLGTTESAASSGAALPAQQLSGSISGIIVDESSAAVVGAHVKLTPADQSKSQEVVSGDDGQFSFANVLPGPLQINVIAEGFTSQTISATLTSGEILVVPQIKLAVAPNITVVQVKLTKTEAAEVQIKEEEKQRVLGFMPNFYVSYDPQPIPLDARQKFELAWKTTVNPVSFGMIGAIAGIQQAENSYGGYGQGAQGYGKRYGAAYVDFVTGTYIGGAILPSLLHQDPRYFYKGTGSKQSRVFYALASAVICKGDNGRWQPNYSNVLGSIAAGGISNAYYPASERGAGLTFENAFIGIGATGVANVFQEFIVRKLTPHLASHASSNDPSKP